jgi:hypothetical protein
LRRWTKVLPLHSLSFAREREKTDVWIRKDVGKEEGT